MAKYVRFEKLTIRKDVIISIIDATEDGKEDSQVFTNYGQSIKTGESLESASDKLLGVDEE